MTTLLSLPSPPTGRHRLRRIGVIAGASLVALVATLLAGIAFETIATTLDRRAYPAPGVMVDVGGQKLHLACTGQGSPTVILETGFGATSSAWALVQPAVAASTRTCAYDRAGLGWSEPGPEPRDARRIATELHSLLQAAGIAGPYLLVGHSNGGLYARMYASMYPADVAGIVLVEATPSDLLTRLPEVRSDFADLSRQADTAELLAHFGLARLLVAPRARAELDGFPAAATDAVVATQGTAGFWRTLAAEARVLETSLNEVQQAGGLGAWPLAVLWTPEGSPSPEAAATKQQLEAEMTALSSNSVQVMVAGATHMGFATRPEHAAITVQAIGRVVDAVRSGQPLSSMAARP